MNTNEISNYCKNAGIILIILGVIHIVLSGFLSAVWGYLLIILGIIALIYRVKAIILLVGIMLISIGILNIFGSIVSEIDFLWIIFGGFQIYLGSTEIIRYTNIKEKPKKRNYKKRKNAVELKGLGGWLILPIIGFFISGFFIFYELITVISEMGVYGDMGLIILLIDLVFLLLIVGSLVLIFMEKRYAPMFVIVAYAANILLVFLLYMFFESSIEESVGDVASIIFMIIWIVYFSVSRRVKNTFVK